MSRCLHHLEICEDCGGLSVTELANAADIGIASVTLNMADGSELRVDPEQTFLGPIKPCDGERS